MSPALAGWSASPEVAPILQDFERFALGSDMSACPELADLFEEGGSPRARNFAQGFVSACLAALAEGGGLGLPLPHRLVGGQARIVLATAERTQLMIVSHFREPIPAGAEPESVTFHPAEIWSHFLGGGGTLERVSCTGAGENRAGLRRERTEIRPGRVTHALGLTEALRVVAPEAGLVELRLRRKFGARVPDRHYSLADGHKLGESAGCPREGRLRMVMTALAGMGRQDAVAPLATIAAGRGSAPLRLQALEQMHALDRRAALGSLAAIAEDLDDPLAAATADLRDTWSRPPGDRGARHSVAADAVSQGSPSWFA